MLVLKPLSSLVDLKVIAVQRLNSKLVGVIIVVSVS